MGPENGSPHNHFKQIRRPEALELRIRDASILRDTCAIPAQIHHMSKLGNTLSEKLERAEKRRERRRPGRDAGASAEDPEWGKASRDSVRRGDAGRGPRRCSWKYGPGWILGLHVSCTSIQMLTLHAEPSFGLNAWHLCTGRAPVCIPTPAEHGCSQNTNPNGSLLVRCSISEIAYGSAMTHS